MSSISANTALPASSGTNAPERGPLLLWMIFTGLCFFAVFLLWRYGLIHQMVTSDRTYISSLIVGLYIVTSCHCLWRTRAIAREGEIGNTLSRDAVGSGGTQGLYVPMQPRSRQAW